MEQYVGLNPGGGIVEANYIEDLFVETGEDTYENVIVASGQVLPTNSVIAISTVDFKAYEWDKAGANGLDKPYGVLVHAIDTSATGINADDEIQVLRKSTRRLNPNALNLHASWTDLGEVAFLLSQVGITLRRQGYSG